MDSDPVPDGFEYPSDVELLPSGVDKQRTGVWCTDAIGEGTKYGPYKGRRVSEPEDEMNPTFVWEIIDPDTDETTFYVDATDPKDGCWLRYINCARFFEEQNLVSEQIGMDIYYRVIKDIGPGEEMLTWYEKTPLRKRKKGGTKNVKNKKGYAKSQARSRSVSPQSMDVTSETDNATSVSPVKAVSDKRQKRSAAAKASRFLDAVRRCERMQDDHLSGDEASESDPEIETETRSITESTTSSLSHTVSEPGLSSTAKPGEYLFEMLPRHILKSKSGKKIYKCDICSGEYKHAFSLKRHYIRNHINYKYVCAGDVLNCKVSLEHQQAQTRKLRLLYGIDSNDNNKCLAGDDDGAKIVADVAELDKSDGESSGDSDDTIITEYIKKERVKDEKEDAKSGEIADDDSGDNDDAMDNEKATVGKADAVEPKTEPNESTENAQKENISIESKNVHTEDEIHDSPPESGCDIDKSRQDCDTNQHSNIEQNDKKTADDDQSAVDETTVTDTCTQPSDTSLDKSLTINKEVKESSSGSGGSDSSNVILLGLYRCGICSQLFDSKEPLKYHLKNHPEVPSVKTYKCSQCDMKFPHRQNLARHLAVHTGSKPYSCRFCGKCFPTGTNQKRHERIHLGRRVTCDFCSSTFSQTGDLKKHVRKLHPEFFNECAFCGKYFSDLDCLEDHLNEHHHQSMDSNGVVILEATRRAQDYKIDVESDMAESMRLAANRAGSKFACTVCKKRFSDYANMCRHRRLAHQRPILVNHRPSMDDLPVQSFSDDNYLDPNNMFYANVSQNIADNMKYFVEGKREHLEDANVYIKCNEREDGNMDTPSVSDQESETLSLYNFPKGFKLKQDLAEASENPEGNPGRVYEDSSAVRNEDFDFEDIQSVSDQELPSQAECDTLGLPIRVPQFQTCKVCHAVFLEFATYAKHMWDKHKTSVLKQESAAQNQRNKVIQSPMPAHTNHKIIYVAPEQVNDLINPGKKTVPPAHSGRGSLGTPMGKLFGSSPSVVSQTSVPTRSQKTEFPLDLSASTEYIYQFCGPEMPHSNLPSASTPYEVRQVAGNVTIPGEGINHTNDDGVCDFLCSVCQQMFDSYIELEEHQNIIHPGMRSFSADTDSLALIPPPQYFVPSPTGQLQVCTVPLVTAKEMTYKCTKCNKHFSKVEDLHDHIINCADIGKQEEKYINKAVTDEHSKREKRYRKPSNSNSELGLNALYRDIFRRKKKNFCQKKKKHEELLYNPHNHIRRREMTEIVDMHMCRGCGMYLKSIILLERHVKVCDGKEKLKELEVLKPIFNPYETSQKEELICIYCQKSFMYLGTLNRHLQQGTCPVRQDIMEKKEYIDKEWEDDISSRCHVLHRQSSNEIDGEERETHSWRGRRRGKRKNHRWCTVKKRVNGANGSNKAENNEEDVNDEAETYASFYGGSDAVNAMDKENDVEAFSPRRNSSDMIDVAMDTVADDNMDCESSDTAEDSDNNESVSNLKSKEDTKSQESNNANDIKMALASKIKKRLENKSSYNVSTEEESELPSTTKTDFKNTTPEDTLLVESPPPSPVDSREMNGVDPNEKIPDDDTFSFPTRETKCAKQIIVNEEDEKSEPQSVDIVDIVVSQNSDDESEKAGSADGETEKPKFIKRKNRLLHDSKRGKWTKRKRVKDGKNIVLQAAGTFNKKTTKVSKTLQDHSTIGGEMLQKTKDLKRKRSASADSTQSEGHAEIVPAVKRGRPGRPPSRRGAAGRGRGRGISSDRGKSGGSGESAAAVSAAGGMASKKWPKRSGQAQMVRGSRGGRRGRGKRKC